MKKILLISLLTILPALLYALPKSILADKYLLGAKTSLDKQNYQLANDYFQKIVELDIEVPNDFYFQYAKNSLKLKEYDQSLKYINIYFGKAGKSGKYYNDALLMSNKAEEEQLKTKAKKQKQQPKPESTPEPEPEQQTKQKQEEKTEIAIPKYTLTIIPIPADARVQITNIKEVYVEGISLKEGKYTVMVSKKNYGNKFFTMYLNKDINKTIKLKKIMKKAKKKAEIWHCSARSVRASGWVERVGLENAKKGALEQCEIRRQSNVDCNITSCYKIK